MQLSNSVQYTKHLTISLLDTIHKLQHKKLLIVHKMQNKERRLSFVSVLDVIVHSCGRDKAGRTERQRASAIFSLKASTVKALTLNAIVYSHKIGLTHKPAALFLCVCLCISFTGTSVELPSEHSSGLHKVNMK